MEDQSQNQLDTSVNDSDDEPPPVRIYSSRVDIFEQKILGVSESELQKFEEDCRLSDLDERNTEEENKNKVKNKKSGGKNKAVKSKKSKRGIDDDADIITLSDHSDGDNQNEDDSFSIPDIKIFNTRARKRRRNTTANRLLRKIDKQKQLYENKEAASYSSSEDDDILCLDNIPKSRNLNVKFKWKATIFRISMESIQKFGTILEELGNKCNTTALAITLFLNGRIINPDDTPDSLKLSLLDIIDCYVTDKNLKKQSEPITLQVQSNDCNKKITISINKNKPMLELMKEYAKQRNLPLSKLSFKFDGEVISGTETSIDLDMEDEDNIDVTVS